MHIIVEKKDLETIDWSAPTIEILLRDAFCWNHEVFDIIWKMSQRHKNKTINLYSGEGPALVFFQNAPNIKWHLHWEKNVVYRFWKDLQNVDLEKIIPQTKKIENFLCSFNGAFHLSRSLSCIGIRNLGLWNSNYCSKNFIIPKKELKKFSQSVLVKLTNNLSKNELEKFLSSTHTFDYKPYDFIKDLHILTKFVNKSFVQIVNETNAENSFHNITEKVFIGILNKTITITVGQRYWYKMFTEFWGFKTFDCFDYNFDTFIKVEDRICNILDQIKNLSALDPNQLQEIYHANQKILDYNYNHFISGNWLKFAEESFKQLDKRHQEPYNTIGEK